MAWITFGTLTSPQPANQTLDPQFSNVAALGSIPCTATSGGGGVILLTPVANTPPVTSYPDLQPSFVFEAPTTTAAQVTINVSGVGARNAYKWNGVQALNQPNDIQIGLIYRATPLQALNGGSGGFAVDAIGGSSSLSDAEFIIDGGGNPITTGVKGYLRIPFPALIQFWAVMADQSGSIVVDVLRANSAVPTTSMIGSGNKPTLTAAQLAAAATSGWTSTTLADSDWLGFNVVSASTVTRVTVDLVLQKI